MIFQLIKKIKFILGFLFFLCGIVGLIVPLLPTTPFILLAIYFFKDSSPQFYRWCLNIPFVNTALYDWRKHRIIGKKAKIHATILIFFSFFFIIYRDDISGIPQYLVLSLLGSVWIFLIFQKSH